MRAVGIGWAAVAAWLAACAPAQPPADLVICLGGAPSSLDPQRGTSLIDQRVAGALFEGLFRMDGASVEPACAESWTVSPDGLLWTITLEDGLRWSDGRPLTAADFTTAWERLRAPATRGPYAGLLDVVAEAAATDERTLLVRLTQPDPVLPARLAQSALAPLPGADPDFSPGRLVGNGPFLVSGRCLGLSLRLVANPHYREAHPPARPRTLDLLVADSPTAMLNLFEGGEADWIPTVPLSLVGHLAQRPDFHQETTMGTVFLRAHTGAPPLDDIRVRRALSLALDRASMAGALLAGAAPAWRFTPPTAPDRGEAAGTKESAEEARALLQSAGGGDLPGITLQTSGDAEGRRLAEALQARWRAVLGLEVRIRVLDGRTLLANQREGRYQLSLSSWFADIPDASDFMEIWRTDSPNNRTGWASPVLDDLLDRARAASPEARPALLARAEAELLAGSAAVPLHFTVARHLVGPRTTYRPDPLGRHPLRLLEFAR